MRSTFRPSLVAIAIGLALVACSSSKSSSSDTQAPTIPDADPNSIEILPTGPRAAASGGTLQLGLKAVYANGAVEYVTTKGAYEDVVTWASGDEDIATVSAGGLATGALPGYVTVTATYRSQTTRRILTVTPPPVALRIFPPTIRVDPEGTTPYSVIAVYGDDTAAPVTPKETEVVTGDTEIATVSPAEVKAVGLGGTTLTVTIDGKSATAPVIVETPATPPDVTGMIIDGASEELAQGTTGTFIATAMYSDTTEGDVTGDVTWSSSDESVFTVDGGVVTPVGAGTATLKASLSVEGVTDPFTAQMSVTVLPASVVLSELEIVFTGFEGVHTLPLDVVASFKAVGHFSDGHLQNLTDQVEWNVVNADETDLDTHAVLGLNPGEVSTDRGTLDLGYMPGDVLVKAKFAGSDAAADNAEYALTIGGLLDSITIASDSNLGSLAVGDQPVFMAVGHYKDGATDLAFEYDLTNRVMWLDSRTLAGEAPVVAVDNTEGAKGQGYALADGSATITARYLAFTFDADTTTLTPYVRSGSVVVTVGVE